MKQILFSLCATATIFSLPLVTTAQKSNSNSKTEEVVIVKKGQKDAKITLEMNGDNILVNGKPLDEFIADGVTIKVYDLEKTLHRQAEHLHNLSATMNKRFSNWNDSLTKGKNAFLGITTNIADKGVKIANVETGSAAEKAGLKVGDIIQSINGKSITDPDNLVKAIHGFKPKDDIQITYDRNGKIKNTQATLGETENVFRNFSFSNRNNINGLFDPKLFSETFTQNSNDGYNFMFNSNHKLGLKIEDLDEGEGVKVTNVEDNSAAEKAGIKNEDIITQVEGNKVMDVNDMRQKLRDTRSKTSYSIKGNRNGTEMTFNIKIPKNKNKADL